MASAKPPASFGSSPTLPLHALLEALAGWAQRPGPPTLRPLRLALEQTMTAHGAGGVYVLLDAPPLPRLATGVGDLRGGPPARDGGDERASVRQTLTRPAAGPALETEILAAGRPEPLGTIWVSGPPSAAAVAAAAISAAFGSAWALAEARAATGRLEALDAAARAIAGELELDRVLQLIVDRVRPLVGARYAALGIFDRPGHIERFLTSGLTLAQRTSIGQPPVGRGLLGLIIREGRSFRIRDITRHPDRYGFPPHHPSMHSFLGVPVSLGGQVGRPPVGNLYLTDKRGAEAFSEGDQRLVESFALHAGIAIQNARLHARVQALAVVEDRERIGKNLHDGIIQDLYGVSLSLEDVPELLADEPAEAGRRVERAIQSLHHTIRDIRNFIYELQPDLLAGTTLAAGAASLVAELRQDTGLAAELHIQGLASEPPPSAVREVLAILSEALSNVARHARATTATVEIAGRGGALTLTVLDDGVGLPPGRRIVIGHQGLRNMRARAERLGGTLHVEPGPGRGTRVSLRVGRAALARAQAQREAG